MITPHLKAAAIARLHRSMSVEAIAADLEIPRKVVQDWKNALNPYDLIKIESNIHAVETVTSGELVDEVDANELQSVLELTAIDLARQASTPGQTGDVVQAKAIELCANAVTKLYSTIVLKNTSGVILDQGGSGTGMAAFLQNMKD